MQCMEEAKILFFAAHHHEYARFSEAYTRIMEQLPEDILDHFKKGHHTVHLKDGLFNGIWTDMAIEATWMKKGKGPGKIKYKMKYEFFRQLSSNSKNNLT